MTLSGSIDARIDTIDQVERAWRVDVRDRGVQRPPLSLRHARATLRKGTLTADLGKQFVRWGKADILNPTDRFAPRDFLEVTDDEFLAVIGARGQYQRGPHSIDIVWVPIFTPSRTPLVGRRWAPPPPQTFGPTGFVDVSPVFPDRSQYGARWNVLAPGFEFSLSYFDGFNHLPQFTTIPLSSRPLIALQRTYAPLRMAGADAAVPLRWFTVKGEIASLVTTSKTADDVVVYVVQLERQSGELSLVAGYAGEIVTERRSIFDFAPDRGLTTRISRPRGLHDRRHQRRLRRSRRPPESRRRLDQGAVFRGHRRALARDIRGRCHRRPRARLHRPVPPQLPSSRDAKI